MPLYFFFGVGEVVEISCSREVCSGDLIIEKKLIYCIYLLCVFGRMKIFNKITINCRHRFFISFLLLWSIGA
jgi:hypothetical protein